MKVSVINYDIGNLLSVSRALEVCGGDVTIVTDPKDVSRAERLVVPGVGAFGDCIAALRVAGFEDPIKEFAATGRPYLGICVGMQMLFDVGLEFGEHAGLGLIEGQVVEIARHKGDGSIRKRPHIGWTPLIAPGQDWGGSILSELSPGVKMYFVHTFTAVPSREEDRLADCDYDGFRISASVKKGNLYGTQFHPEKSGPEGLKVVRQFLTL